jgi:hypothetical protein
MLFKKKEFIKLQLPIGNMPQYKYVQRCNITSFWKSPGAPTNTTVSLNNGKELEVAMNEESLLTLLGK